MRKVLNIIVAVVLASGLFLSALSDSPVKADITYDYYIQFNVTDNSGIARTNVPVITGINITSLINQGFLNAQASDNNLLASDGTVVPYTVRNDNLNFVIPSLLGLETKTFYFYMTSTPLKTQYHLVVGEGGNVTVNDSPNLRLASNFTYSLIGAFNTTAGSSLISKPNSYSYNFTSSGILSVLMNLSGASTSNATTDGQGNLTEWPTLSGASTHWQATNTNDGNTTYVAQTSAAGTVTDLYTVSNVSNFGNITAVAVFMVVSAAPNAADSNVRTVLYTHNTSYSGQQISLRSGSANQSLGVYLTFSTNYTNNPNTGTTWTSAEIYDMQIGAATAIAGGQYCRLTQSYAVVYLGSNPVLLTASGFTSVNQSIGISLNSNNLSITRDGSTINSTTTSGSVAETASNITLFSQGTLLYASNITLAVNGTQQLWYSPNLTISGTTLPNRQNSGTNDGVIVWGANPTTYNISIGSVVNVLYRIPIVSNAKSFSNYITSGDLLFVAELINVYPPYYPARNPVDYFQVQLIDSDNTTIIAATPEQDWGDVPVSIYLNPTMAATLNTSAIYYIRVQANFATRVAGQVTLNTTDWKGNDLTQLDSWCILTAQSMQSYNGGTGYTVKLTGGVTAITDTAGGWFTTGIPGIAQQRPNLFTTAKQSPVAPTGTANTSWDDNTWATNVGTGIAADANILATMFGKTGKDMLAGILVIGMLGIVIAGTMSLGGFGSLGLFLMTIPLLWLGTYLRIVSYEWITILAIAFGFLAVRQFFIKTT